MTEQEARDDAEIIGISCANAEPHEAHNWQMSATGYCRCLGVRSGQEVRDDEREAPVWDDARIREAFIYDGGEAAYHDPINGDLEQRRVAGEIFDLWLAAHDAALLARERPERVEYEYTGCDYDGSPDAARIRNYGSAKPGAPWRRRKAGAWELNPEADPKWRGD